MINVASLLSKLPYIRKRLDEHMLEVISGASVALLLKLLAAGIGFAFNIVLTRLLPVDSVGLYYLALTVLSVGVVASKMGLENALLRFVAANAANKDWVSVKGVLNKAFKPAVIAALIVALAMAVSATFIAERVFSAPELKGLIQWMSLAVLPVTVFTFYSAALRGLKRIRDSMAVLSVFVPFFSLCGVVILAPRWGVLGAVWAYVAGAAITMIIGAALWHRATPKLKLISGVFNTSVLLNSSKQFLLIEVLQNISMWSTTFFMGMWCSSKDVGVFSIAYRTAALTSFILVAVNSISAPKFAALYQKGDMDGLGLTARNTALIMPATAIPVLALFCLAPGWIMGYIYGPSFSEGALALTVLAAGQFVNVATGSVGYLLVMSGHERHYRDNVAFSLLMHIILSILLIPRFGITGAALATAVSTAMVNLIATVIVRFKMGIMTIPGFNMR